MELWGFTVLPPMMPPSSPSQVSYLHSHLRHSPFPSWQLLCFDCCHPCTQIRTLDPFWYFVCSCFQAWPFCIGKTSEQILAVFTMVLYCNDHSCSAKIMGREGNLRNSFGGHKNYQVLRHNCFPSVSGQM